MILKSIEILREYFQRPSLILLLLFLMIATLTARSGESWHREVPHSQAEDGKALCSYCSGGEG